ncbi:hypothetical protein K439DRAFT_1612334 [Ramaria rubella]|nr:hypothetical protein K439DRAFT_1612334 [Ramaria rubella]
MPVMAEPLPPISQNMSYANVAATSRSLGTHPLPKPTAKPRLAGLSFLAWHHESWLIVKITPVLSHELQSQNSGLRIQDTINEKLCTNEDTKHMLIGLVSWSNIGSAIINTVDGLTANELEPHASLFLELLPHALGATFTTHIDSPWHKVTLNSVSTHSSGYSDSLDNALHEIPTSQQLLEELLHYN